MLHKNSIIPLYYQLQEILKEKIIDGTLVEGQLVPSERELMEIYNISRATARKALDGLMFEGLIKKKQGVGTFVAPKKVLQDLNGEIAFAQLAYEQGLRPSFKLYEATIEKDTSPRILNIFNLDKSDEIFKFSGLVSANDIPLFYVTTHIPLKLAPTILEKNLESTIFYEYIEKELKIKITHSTLEIDSINLNEFESKQLNTILGKSALLVERVYFSEQKAVVVSKSIVLGERSKYVITLKHSSGEEQDYLFQMKIDKKKLDGGE
ncbi:GntR family transcriptional regulator [Neobacillus niacini]|uniref:GntR family transcriptional regulator n=1 Tax=Neobacillus niacini TaxID=86668 RepID=UPI002863EC66|nr:GntR family transcriptional regulator [Neobacillus niacini]MDR7080482.1 GntR family transcriptional regulator [Neobacillus niacini]